MEDVGDGANAESRTQFIGISSDFGQSTSNETLNEISGLLLRFIKGLLVFMMVSKLS